MIPADAIRVVEERLRLCTGSPGADWTVEAIAILEAAAPYMQKGDGENRPGWDDRKALSGVWQGHAPLPEGGLSERVYEALLEVAAWGYQRRMDEEL